MIVLGFSGKARTGKSTICHALFDAAEKAGWAVIPAPFAGPLKREMASKHGYEDVKKFKDEKPEEYRAACQAGGANARAEDPDHWVNKWYEEFLDIQKVEHGDDNEANLPFLLLVDDVRYENELEMLKKNNAFVFFVKHGSRDIEDPNGEWREHESETLSNSLEASDNDAIYHMGYDYVIHNDQPEEHLQAWAKEIVRIVSDLETCDCEACRALIERRAFNIRTLMDEAKKETEDDDE